MLVLTRDDLLVEGSALGRGQQHRVEDADDAALGHDDVLAEVVQLEVVAHREADVTRDDPLALRRLRRVARQLEDLRDEVL